MRLASEHVPYAWIHSLARTVSHNSKTCACLDPSGCEGKCKFPKYKGDGNCDDENK